MPHHLDDLIADLDAAKANLARSVKRCRTLIADCRVPLPTGETQRSDKSAFNWTDRPDR